MSDIPELGPGEVFVNKQTYDQELPGRVSSEDATLDAVYTGRGITGSRLESYYATDIPVRITRLTRLNETDHRVTLEHVVPDNEPGFYDEPAHLILRDGMLLRKLEDSDIPYSEQVTKVEGYLVDRERIWDNALRRELGALQLSAVLA